MNRRRFLAGLPSAGALLYASRFLSGCGGPNHLLAQANSNKPSRAYDYGLCYVPSYGQSLSLGDRGTPPISTKQRFDSLMFAGGVIAQGTSGDLAQDYGSVVPLVEITDLAGFNSVLTGIADPGETPESGTFEAIKELMASQDDLDPGNITYRFLGSAPGHGAYTAAELSRGTVPYQRLIYEVGRAAAIAAQMGLTFGVPAITWMQGEADSGTYASDYMETVQALFSDLNSDILAITNQAKPVHFLMYQTAWAGLFAIANAQYQLSLKLANVHIAGPAYPLQTAWDNAHLTALSYKTMGALFGSAYKRLVVNGEPWLPLSPASITASGNAVMIDLNVYGGASVVADTQTATNTCPIKPSRGFILTSPQQEKLDIDNQVEVTGKSQITITAPKPITSGYVLSYGDVIDGCGGGNIRDNYGDQYVFDGGGLNLPMNNWLTVFAYTFP